MKNIHTWVNTALLAVVLILSLVGGNQSVEQFGQTGTRFPNGVSADSTSPTAGQLRGTTMTITGATTLSGGITATGGASTFATTTTGVLVQGGAVLATSTSNTSETLVENDLLLNSRLEFTSNTGATTYTLPATSTMTNIMSTAGERRVWMFENATTSSGITATFVAGSGINLIGVTVNDDVIDETERAKLDCQVRTDTDWDCIISELINVD